MKLISRAKHFCKGIKITCLFCFTNLFCLEPPPPPPRHHHRHRYCCFVLLLLILLVLLLVLLLFVLSLLLLVLLLVLLVLLVACVVTCAAALLLLCCSPLAAYRSRRSPLAPCPSRATLWMWLCSTSLPGGNQVDGLPPA